MQLSINQLLNDDDSPRRGKKPTSSSNSPPKRTKGFKDNVDSSRSKKSKFCPNSTSASRRYLSIHNLLTSDDNDDNFNLTTTLAVDDEQNPASKPMILHTVESLGSKTINEVVTPMQSMQRKLSFNNIPGFLKKSDRNYEFVKVRFTPKGKPWSNHPKGGGGLQLAMVRRHWEESSSAVDTSLPTVDEDAEV